MPGWGDFLYQLGPRDLTGPQLEVFYRRFEGAPSVTDQTYATIALPKNRILVLNQVIFFIVASNSGDAAVMKPVDISAGIALIGKATRSFYYDHRLTSDFSGKIQGAHAVFSSHCNLTNPVVIFPEFDDSLDARLQLSVLHVQAPGGGGGTYILTGQCWGYTIPPGNVGRDYNF